MGPKLKLGREGWKTSTWGVQTSELARKMKTWRSCVALMWIPVYFMHYFFVPSWPALALVQLRLKLTIVFLCVFKHVHFASICLALLIWCENFNLLNWSFQLNGGITILIEGHLKRYHIDISCQCFWYYLTFISITTMYCLDKSS